MILKPDRYEYGSLSQGPGKDHRAYCSWQNAGLVDLKFDSLYTKVRLKYKQYGFATISWDIIPDLFVTFEFQSLFYSLWQDSSIYTGLQFPSMTYLLNHTKMVCEFRSDRCFMSSLRRKFEVNLRFYVGPKLRSRSGQIKTDFWNT